MISFQVIYTEGIIHVFRYRGNKLMHLFYCQLEEEYIYISQDFLLIHTYGFKFPLHLFSFEDLHYIQVSGLVVNDDMNLLC